MNDFDYDVIQKKRLARQASHRKRGSKSRKCTLLSDQMTPKQWRERCGEVVTYNLKEPIEWEAFKKLPPDVQKIYIDGLMEKFCPTATDLSRVFGATAQTITKYLGHEFGIRFSPGKKMPKEHVKAFREFLGERELETDVEFPESSKDWGRVSYHSFGVPQEELESSRQSDLSMTGFSLTFSGKFSADMIYNSIASMIPAGTDVSLDIRCMLA